MAELFSGIFKATIKLRESHFPWGKFERFNISVWKKWCISEHELGKPIAVLGVGGGGHSVFVSDVLHDSSDVQFSTANFDINWIACN